MCFKTVVTPVSLLAEGKLVFFFCLLHFCELLFKQATVRITRTELEPHTSIDQHQGAQIE